MNHKPVEGERDKVHSYRGVYNEVAYHIINYMMVYEPCDINLMKQKVQSPSLELHEKQ